MKPVVIGPNAVHEMLKRSPRRIREVWVSGSGGRVGRIADEASRLGIPVRSLSEKELQEIAGSGSHQGIAARIEPRPEMDLDDLIPPPPGKAALLMLDQVQDPQNLGSLLRSALAFGLHGAVLPDRNAAHITPAVSKASAGASEILPVAVVTNLARAIDRLKAKRIWVVGLDPKADADLDRAPWTEPVALVLGSEGEGLRRLTAEKCDLLVRIPMLDTFDSLGVAAAGAVAMHALSRARLAR